MCVLYNPLNFRLSCHKKAFRKYTNSSLNLPEVLLGIFTRNNSEFFENNDASHLQIRTAHFLIWKSHICKNVVEGESSKSSDGTQF